MKEVYIEFKKNVKEIAHMSEELSGQMNQLEAVNQAHMERMEVIQMANDSQFSQLNVTLAHYDDYKLLSCLPMVHRAQTNKIIEVHIR